VVTEFVFALHPQRKAVFAGMVVFTHDKFEALIDLTKTWYENIKEDEAMLQTAVLSPEGMRTHPRTSTYFVPNSLNVGHPVLAVTLFYNGSEDEGRANFKNILDLGQYQLNPPSAISYSL
jgi:hypothetical protein